MSNMQNAHIHAEVYLYNTFPDTATFSFTLN